MFMSRAIPLLAVLCTGVALGALVVALIGGTNRTDPGLIEEVAPLDLAAAVPEIAQIRASRGSILAGTSLANKDDSAQFSSALSNQAGMQVPQPETGTLVAQLQHLQSIYEERAQLTIDPGITGQPDKWRDLADSARILLKELAKVEEPESDAPDRFMRR
jgi:hypothetical protein